MGETAHVFSESPPFASLNISSHFGGLPEISARNHRSFLKLLSRGEHAEARPLRLDSSLVFQSVAATN